MSLERNLLVIGRDRHLLEDAVDINHVGVSCRQYLRAASNVFEALSAPSNFVSFSPLAFGFSEGGVDLFLEFVAFSPQLLPISVIFCAIYGPEVKLNFVELVLDFFVP